MKNRIDIENPNGDVIASFFLLCGTLSEYHIEEGENITLADIDEDDSGSTVIRMQMIEEVK